VTTIKIGKYELFPVRSVWGDINRVAVYAVEPGFVCPECDGETFTLHKTDYSDIKCRCCGEPIRLSAQRPAPSAKG
jgi:hypothetical protein